MEEEDDDDYDDDDINFAFVGYNPKQ